MPFLQIQDQQFPLRTGDMTLGGGETDVPVPGVDGVIARIQLANDQVAIRRLSPTAPLTINGVALGTEPSPLLHGDKITVGRVEILFGDDKKQGGGTQVISSGMIPADLLKRSKFSTTAAKPTAATGGRLVSLVDGREFLAKSGGLTLGRDAACDVVLPGNDISRNHAEIAVSPEGYYVIDLSTNGVFVNGEKVEGTRTLGRGDVIRIGNEEFRFYADVPAPGAAPTAAPASAPPPAAKTVESPPRPPRSTLEPTAPPMKPYIPEPPPTFKTPVTPAAPVQAALPVQAAPPAGVRTAAASAASAASPPDRPVLAILEVKNEGPNKGKTYEIHGPLTHVGRGQHNDIVISDDSVSDTHAKIQRRDNGWFVIDVGSTNGTYVGGKRIGGETQIVGAPDVRFGGVKLMFKPTADGQMAEGRTRAIANISPEQAKRMSATASASENSKSAAAEPKKGVPVTLWIAAVVLVGAAVAYFLVGR